jgi:hypothetical protein
MLTLKRLTLLAVATVTTVVCLGGASALGDDVNDLRSEQRDVAGYQRYVTGDYPRGTATDGDGQVVNEPQETNYEWAAEHPDLMLAEGDRACDWLADESDPALFGADESKYGSYAMTNRYLRSAAMGERVQLTEQGPRYVVAGAWTYLCPRTRDDKTTPTSEED